MKKIFKRLAWGGLILGLLLLVAWSGAYLYFDAKGNRDLVRTRAELVALGEQIGRAHV